MSQSSNQIHFSDIKEEYSMLIDEIMKKYLEAKKYNKEESKEWIIQIMEKLINEIRIQEKGFKIICYGAIFKKGKQSLYISSQRLIDPETDDCITYKYNNEDLCCYISLFGFSQNFSMENN